MTRDVSDEMLMALADGELSAGTEAQLLARIAADPDLARRHAGFALTRRAVREACPAEPIPEALIRTILETPAGLEPPAERGENVIPFRPRRALRMALAASLLLAVSVGGFLTGRATGPAPPQVAAGPVAAAQALAALPTGASVPLGDATARVLGSFDTDLGLCRLVALEGTQEEQRAILCRDGTEWTLAFATVTGVAGGFRPASDTGTEAIDHALDTIGAGAAMTGAEEARALGL